MSGFRAGVLFSVVLAAFSYRAAAGEEWGDLELRLVYDGEPPAAPVVVGGLLPPERLVVNPKNKGIANALVYLWIRPDEKVAANPMLEEAVPTKVTMSILADEITPRVQVVRTSQTLVFANLTPKGANVKSEFFNNSPFNFLVPAGEKVDIKFAEREPSAVLVSSSIQLYQATFLLVVDHPYAAVSDKDGKIKLSKLPVGKHTFVVWHEIPGYVKEAHQGGMPIEWKRGRMTVEIAPGENDLGEFMLKPEVFKR